MAAKKNVPTKPAKARKPAAKVSRRAARPAKGAARVAVRKAPRTATAKARTTKPAPKSAGRAVTPAARKGARPAAKSAAKAKKPAATKVSVAKPAPAPKQAPAAKPTLAATKARAAKPAPEPKQAAVAKPAAAEPRKGVAAAREFTGTRAVAMPAKSRRFVAPVEDEEAGEEDRHNLLLGPRNVQPYIERKGEQYMGKEQLEHFRRILESWKQDLMEEVDRTMTHMKDEAANPPDPNDRATLESEFALELRTRDRERKLIRKIEEALKRIEDGSYGYCLETGEPIGIKRLEARPVATLCIEAQERRERREKQYGDRDDWYR
jgi:DnaK suppressor protein